MWKKTNILMGEMVHICPGVVNYGMHIPETGGIYIDWTKAEESTLQGNVACVISSVQALGIRDVEVCRYYGALCFQGEIGKFIDSCFHGAKVKLPPFVDFDVVCTIANLFWWSMN
jgi:hypothetical protein